MGQQMTADAVAAGLKAPVSVHSVTGLGGQGMSVISKGGTGNAHAAGIFEATSLARLAKAADKTFAYGAIILTHGETDEVNPNYGDDLLRMHADYNQDLSAITGQKDPIPLILSQQSTRPVSNAQAPASMLA